VQKCDSNGSFDQSLRRVTQNYVLRIVPDSGIEAKPILRLVTRDLAMLILIFELGINS